MSVSEINHIRYDRSEKNWQTRINNPDLNPSDRELIQRFSRGEISKKEILNRYYILAEGMIKNYDGKLNIDSSKSAKRISAFEWMLDGLIEQGKISKMEVSTACGEIFRKYLKPEDKELINEYQRSADRPIREWEKARQAIINKILSYQDEAQGAIWGTPSKIESYQRFMALQNVTPDSISEDEVKIASYLKAFGLPADPPMGKEEHVYWIGWRDFIKENILPLEEAASSPEMIGDQKIKTYIKDSIKSSYADLLKYLQSKELDADNIDKIRTMVGIFIDFACKIGIPQKELEAIKTKVENTISKPEVKQVNLKEIKRPVVVTPETLPSSVIHFLEMVKINGMSGYQFVKENVKYIILNPQIKSSGSESIFGGESPLGITSSYFPVIEIDTYDEKDKKAPRTALELIDTIMHETFHVYWRKKHFNDQKMLSSAINEGMANLTGYSASRNLHETLFPDDKRGILLRITEALFVEHKRDTLLRIKEALFPDHKRDILLGNRSIENKNNIENDIRSDLAAIGGAIQELGLDPEKTLKDIDIPKFLSASLKGDQENDLDTYPTLTPYAYAQTCLKYLDVFEKERISLSPIFEEIINGKGLLSLNEKKKRSVHKLLANIEPRYGKMKYDEVIKELRRLYGYYAWKEYKPQEESGIKSARAQYKDLNNKDIENWQKQSRKQVMESIQEVRSGKRDNYILYVLVQLHTERKRK